MSPQADYVVSNGTGAAVRSDINGQLAAIVSNNSGASAPATTYAYQFWADTSTNLLKLRNGANSAFITIGDLTAANLGLATLASPTFTGTATIPTLTVSTAANIPLGSAASPTLYFTGDSNTGLYSPGADQVALSTGGTGRLFIDSSGRCGIGTSSPAALLHVLDSSSTTTTPLILRNYAASVNTKVRIALQGQTASNQGANAFIQSLSGTDAGGSNSNNDSGLQFIVTNGGGATENQAMTINTQGRVGIGTTNPQTALHLTTSGAGQFRHSDGTRSIAVGSTGSETFVGSGANLTFLTNGLTSSDEKARIDTSGRLLVGTSTSRNDFFNNTTTVAGGIQLELSASDNLNRFMSFTSNNSDTGGACFIFGKSRGTSANSKTIVQADDGLAQLSFHGADGSDMVEAARIAAQVDGTPGTNDMPGRLVFSTTADGASSPTERVRITQSGRLICGRDTRDATLESTDQFTIEGNGYQGYHALNATAYTIGQNSNSRALRIGSGSGWATTGVSLAAGGTSWGTYSDERLKTDIVELSDCLDSIKDIRCISYRLTDVDEADSKKRLGIIAQDLVGKYDEAVNESRRSDDDETEYLSVQYTDLVPVLIKALQEASSKIETLEARLIALESA